MRRALLLLATLLLAACGGEGPDREDLKRIEHQSGRKLYWLGSSFEGLPLTHSDAYPSPFLVYGECNGEGRGESFHCTGPQVQVQLWPLESPSRYPDHFSCTRTTIRGVPAAQFDGFEIYFGRSLARIYAPSQAHARRAAAALRPLDGSASSDAPLPAPAIDVGEALRRCAVDSLDAKLDELRQRSQIPLFWTGRRFEDMPLFRAEGDGPLVRFMYGGCKTPETAGSCYPKLTIEVTPASAHDPADWRVVRSGAMRCDHQHIRGAVAAYLPYARELYVFTGPLAVVIRGPDRALLRRAADVIRRFDDESTSQELPPPSDELRRELRRVCGT